MLAAKNRIWHKNIYIYWFRGKGSASNMSMITDNKLITDFV